MAMGELPGRAAWSLLMMWTWITWSFCECRKQNVLVNGPQTGTEKLGRIRRDPVSRERRTSRCCRCQHNTGDLLSAEEKSELETQKSKQWTHVRATGNSNNRQQATGNRKNSSRKGRRGVTSPVVLTRVFFLCLCFFSSLHSHPKEDLSHAVFWIWSTCSQLISIHNFK
jgi:hypothetical protein